MTAPVPAVRSPGRRLGPLDLALVVVFLVGLYLGVSLQITDKIPLTCAPSGVAGLILLWRFRNDVTPAALAGLLGVLAVYLGSILAASDYSFLPKRFTGLIQLVYSMVIAYGLFLALVRGERNQIAWVLLGFCLFIIVGCLFENYGGLRDLSDRVRERIYERGLVYDADLRDEVLYGRVRPKLFTSEPSAVTFAFTHYCAAWLVVSPWRYKLLVYFGLMACALVVMPGPTLVLMLLLTVPYLLFLAGRGKPTVARFVGAAAFSVLLVAAAIVIGQSLFAERLHELATGKDASFFYRFTGPMLVAFDIFKHHTLAGAGLTGEPYIANDVINVYMNASGFQAAWRFTRIGEALTNYFWLHWIYLGLMCGVLVLLALSMWLRLLGVSSVVYCWAVWVILGQASGAYVGPKTWAVLLIAAAASVLVGRSSRRQLAILRPVIGPSPEYARA
jgi:hypothetical protein